MVQTIASVGLPIDETLKIQKNRLIPKNGLHGGENVSVLSPARMATSWKGSMSAMNCKEK